MVCNGAGGVCSGAGGRRVQWCGRAACAVARAGGVHIGVAAVEARVRAAQLDHARTDLPTRWEQGGDMGTRRGRGEQGGGVGAGGQWGVGNRAGVWEQAASGAWAWPVGRGRASIYGILGRSSPKK
eukprot:7378823-Prymnesium_polylepis.1